MAVAVVGAGLDTLLGGLTGLISIPIFPKLALGLSRFKTGVALMPLVKGDKDNNHDEPKGSIRNTRKLLATVAVVMSAYLVASSVRACLVPPGYLTKADAARVEIRVLRTRT